MTYLCTYCARPTENGPWIDADGTGWAPNCWAEECERLADCDATRQRTARFEHDEEKTDG